MAARVLKEGHSVSFLCGDQFHRRGDLPAYVRENERGVVVVEEYWYNGVHHRKGDRPAIIHRNNDGEAIRVSYYVNGLLHRDGDEPAFILLKGGVHIYESFWKRGILHRDRHQPAIIKRHENGKIRSTEYYRQGELTDANEEKLMRVIAEAIKVNEIE